MTKKSKNIRERNNTKELSKQELISLHWKVWLEYEKINLDLAGIMFVNAVLQFDQGIEAYKALEEESKIYEQIYRERAKEYEVTTESFYTYMLPKLRAIEIKYEPVVRYFSTCKILLVCCAEAFINEVASAKLTGRYFQEFDKLSIIGKWMFLQDLLQLKSKIMVDRNPLQDFDSLVSQRNKLVHFKGLSKKLNPFVIPDFLLKLKLTPQECEKNIQAVRILVKQFNLNWRGSSGPDWLNPVKKYFRNPCFYTGSRDVPMYLYSEKHDSHRY